MTGWPMHEHEPRPWVQTQRGGTRADRTFKSVEVALPPFIAGLDVPVDSALALDMETALAEIVALDHADGGQLQALGTLLLRTESVASSKIEAVEATIDDYARALHGSNANASARSMVAATAAMDSILIRPESRAVGSSHRRFWQLMPT